MQKRTKRPGVKKRTTISLDPDLKRKGEDQARKRIRSFSNYLEVLIESDLAANNGEATA